MKLIHKITRENYSRKFDCFVLQNRPGFKKMRYRNLYSFGINPDLPVTTIILMIETTRTIIAIVPNSGTT